MKQKYFIGISFTLTWLAELVLIFTGHTNDVLFDIVYPLLILLPALSVFITKYAVKEPIWYNFWLKPEGRKTIRYSIVGWLAPMLLIFVGVLLYFLIFRGQFDGNMAAQVAFQRAQNNGLKDFTDRQIRNMLWQTIFLNLLLAPLTRIFTCIGEEAAWRGYFLNMLCEKHPIWRAILINGVVWGIWYMPLVIAGQAFYGIGYPGYPITGILGMIIYCIAQGILYSYLTIKTFSCIPAMFANASVGAMRTVGCLFLKEPEKMDTFLNPMPASPIGGIGFLAAAVVILYLFYKHRIQPAEKKQFYDSPKKMANGSLKSRLDNDKIRRNR